MLLYIQSKHISGGDFVYCVHYFHALITQVALGCNQCATWHEERTATIFSNGIDAKKLGLNSGVRYLEKEDNKKRTRQAVFHAVEVLSKSLTFYENEVTLLSFLESLAPVIVHI